MSEDEVQVSKDEAKRLQSRRTRNFVVIFIATVFISLFGYRLLIHTVVNDWYLFQVARSTNVMLGTIGYDSSLELSTSHAATPQQTRATISAWWNGEDPSQDATTLSEFSDDELSPWEKWRYRAEISRRLGSNKKQGPQINFILTPGLHTFLHESIQERKIIRQDQGLDEIERQAAVKEVNTTIRSLRTQIKAVQNTSTPQAPDTPPLHPIAFVFIIVSECGAIEIMAIFIAAVLAFPTRLKAKLVGVVVGVPIMYFLNVFRLGCLATLGAIDKGGKWFDFVHHYVWQSVYVIFVVFVWLAWVEFVVRRKPGA